jgi:pimeloyl-ACP methyl ester carboxylesterase
MEYARTITRDDGVTVAYRITPARERAPGRAVVLLHGLASNLTRWSEFVEQTSLADRWDMLRVDLRGHGDSPTTGAIGHALWCGDLAAVLDAEGHPRAVFVGHSLGAQVALQFAARHPARTHALALIDPVFREALRGRWRLLAAAGPVLHAAAVAVRVLNAIGLRRRTIPPLDLRALDEMARRALGSKEAEAEFIRRYSSMCADLRTFRSAHYLQELVEMFRPVPLAEIAAPALVLLSAGGTFADPDAMQRCLQRLPQVQVRRIDCHHWPLTERPAEVRQAIEDWCARLAPGPAQRAGRIDAR